MEFQNVIESRRSIRKYKDKNVEKEKIEAMLYAAYFAPSWKNSQTARYYVISGEKTLEEVRASLPDFNKKNTSGAPVLIVTTIVKNISGFNNDKTPSNELGNGWGYYDCGLNNMLLVLKAEELGLATLIMGLRDEEKIRKTLNIPAEENVVSVIAVGYADIAPDMPKRKDISETAKFFEE